MQESLIFHPTVLDADYSFRAGEEVNLHHDNGDVVNGIWLRQPASKGVILYWHGNRGSAARALYQTRHLQGHGYDIFIPDYRGFGKSSGSLSHEKDMFADAELAYEFLLEKYDESKIAILGYSLGTGPATYLAHKYDPQKIFLITPFTSISDRKDEVIPIIPDFLIKYNLNNAHHLTHSHEEVHILHGTRDEVIPIHHGQRLSQIRSDIHFHPLDGTSHRQAIFHPSVFQVLANHLE